MPVKINHGVSLRGDADDNGEDSARYITESCMSGVRVFNQSSLQEEACIKVAKIKIDDCQPSMMEIVIRSAIESKSIIIRLTVVSKMIRCGGPHHAHTLFDFTVENTY
jgi:hypothetical protein